MARLVLVTRAMEKVTIANQVHNVRFAGHSDTETVADIVVRELRAAPLPDRIGIEKWTSGLPAGLAEQLASSFPGTPWSTWQDISGLIDEIRLIKSPAEQDYMRAAARVTDAATSAGIEAIHAGVTEAEIAAACLAVMAREGTYPGFGPFIRSTARLGEEHTTWSQNRLAGWRRGLLRTLRLRRALSRAARQAGACGLGPRRHARDGGRCG